MRGFDSVNLWTPGPQLGPADLVWLHRNLVFLWLSWSDDTGAGGLMPQFVMTPTIWTHCFLRWGQTPVPTSESGRWLHTGGLLPLDSNKLETPSGDRRCRGLLLQDTQSLDMRGSFYWTPTGWAHPRVAYPWGLLSLDTQPFDLSVCFFFNITGILRDRHQPPLAVAGPFQDGSGGGMYLCQTLGTRFKDCSIYTRVEYTEDWPGGCRFGWECSPTTLVALTTSYFSSRNKSQSLVFILL